MHAQLESQTQDTEVQDIAEELGGSLQVAFDSLIERRDRQYAAEIELLDAEIELLTQESVSLGEEARDLELLLPAKAAVAHRAAEELLVARKHKKAEAKLAEAEEARQEPERMKKRQWEISVRIDALDAMKQAAAGRIFASWYEDCQAIIRPVEHGLFVVLLDGLQQSFLDFQTRTNNGANTLVKNFHIQNLSAAERSQEWTAGNRWYGGRVR